MGGWVDGWVGGWIRWKYSQLSPAKAEARAELGNKRTSVEKPTRERVTFLDTLYQTQRLTFHGLHS